MKSKRPLTNRALLDSDRVHLRRSTRRIVLSIFYQSFCRSERLRMLNNPDLLNNVHDISVDFTEYPVYIR